MPDLFDLRQETQPSFLGDHTPKHPFWVRDQYLPSSKLDKHLLNQFQRRMSLDRDRSLYISSTL